METGFFNLSSSFYVASMNDKLVKTFLRQSAIECDILIGHELKVQFYVMMVHITWVKSTILCYDGSHSK